MGSEHYCLRWNNHQNNLLGVFSQLLQDESLVDVTLACAEGHSIRAHKVVLSACSSYFQSLFVDHPGRHPIVILKDVCFSELRTLVEFMYRGEVNVEYCRLSALLKTAESLKVKGLAEMTHLRGASGAPPRQDDSEPPRAPEHPPSSTTPRPDSPPPPTATQPPATPPDTAGPCEDLDTRSRSPDADDDLSSVHSGPSDMTISRLPSPHPTEPQPGPSGLPPVQQVPLSLKKEVDWDRSEDGDGRRSVTGESSSEYRHPHDPILNNASEELWTSFKYGYKYTLKAHQGNKIGHIFHSLRPFENPTCGLAEQCCAYYMEVCLVEGVYGPTCFPRHRGTPYDQLTSGRTTPFQYPPFPPLPSCYPHSETLLSLLSQQGLLPPLPPTEGTLRCAVCLAGFPSAWLLEQHTALQHSGQAPRSHAPEPTEDKPFRCDQCGQSYRYRSAFLKHREQNHRARLPADKLFTCDVCGMQFRYLKSFKKHRLNHALERLHNPFHRPGSAASDSRRSERSERSERSDRGDRSDTRSENSERSEGVSTSARSVNDEVTSTNEAEGSSNPPATSPCPPEQDDTVDSLALALGSNEASLLGLLRLGAEERQRERRSFACPFCGKCVRSKENLKLHVRKHTGERPFACLFCGRAFGGKSDLTRHLRIHTGERPYHCEMCGKCFARADYLSKHLTTHIHNSHHQR